VTSGEYYGDYQSFGYSHTGAGAYTAAASVLSSIAANVAGIHTSESTRELPALTVDSVKKRLNERYVVTFCALQSIWSYHGKVTIDVYL